MYLDRIKEAIKQLTLVSALLAELMHRMGEIDCPGVSEYVENYLNRSVFSVNNVDSKLNLDKEQKRQVWTEKEKKDMPYLKDLKYRLTKDGIHQFRYRRDGYNLSFNSKDFEVAKQKAYSFIKGLKQVIRSEADVYKGKTVDFVAQSWFELKKLTIDFNTLRGYQSVYNNHIYPTFGNKSIKNLLPLHLQPFFNELYSSKGKTCENAKIILNGIFQYAVANRLCPTNPMAGVLVQKHYRITGNALNDEQIERFKIKMPGHGPIGLAGLIILYSGIRGCELESMTFDWMSGTFTVKNGKLKRGQRENPKNLYRTVPIFPGLWALRERIESEEWKIAPRKLPDLFSECWKENTIKDLRHTFSTKARQAGVENELVNLWTGHLPGNNVTANVYTHFSLDFQKAQAEKVNNY